MINKNILFGLWMIWFLILLVGTVSAITWRHSGTDTMSLIDSGNLNVLGNITGSWFKGLWDGSSDYFTSAITQTYINANVSSANTSMKSYVDALNVSQTSWVSGNYVPYTSSNANVVLGAHNFSVDTSVLFIDSSANLEIWILQQQQMEMLIYGN